MTRLLRVSVTVPEPALEAWEAALAEGARAVDFYQDQITGDWTVSAVREPGGEGRLAASVALAAVATGISPEVTRAEIPDSDWLAETARSFPKQLIGRRFALRGTHLADQPVPRGRIVLTFDAGMAFGSGEHASTRLCLGAIERLARRPTGRILDLGTGSGVLAMAAARIWHRPVLATDIEARAATTAAENAARNEVGRLIRAHRADGWRAGVVRAGRPYDLVLANILARPLCLMARDLATGLAPGGRVVLAGLLATQARRVLAAHRRHGLVLERMTTEDGWASLTLHKRKGAPLRAPLS